MEETILFHKYFFVHKIQIHYHIFLFGFETHLLSVNLCFCCFVFKAQLNSWTVLEKSYNVGKNSLKGLNKTRNISTHSLLASPCYISYQDLGTPPWILKSSSNSFFYNIIPIFPSEWSNFPQLIRSVYSKIAWQATITNH